jgi:hypothetical protein
MKQLWNQMLSEMTLWALSVRRASREFPDDNDLVCAILSRQATEKRKDRGKQHRSEACRGGEELSRS